MSRWLLALNLVLALFLGFQVARNIDFADAVEAQTREISRVYGRDGKGLRSLSLDLGAELDEVESGGYRPVDLGLRIEPEFPMETLLHAPGQVELAFRGALPRAGRYTIHCSRALSLVGGGRLGPGVLLQFETPAVSLQRVTIGLPSEAGVTTMLASFDLPVELEAVRKRLRLLSAVDDAEIPVQLEVVPWGDRELIRITPQVAEIPDEVVVTVAPGLLPLGGEVPTVRELRYHLKLREPLFVTEARFVGRALRLSFNHDVPRPLSELIELEPAIPFSVLRSGSSLRIVGDFPPGEVLSVRLLAGFPGMGRVTLGEDERRSLLVPDRQPELGFARRGDVLSARAEPQLEVRSVNLRSFTVTARRVYPNNVVRMLQRGDRQSTAPEVTREYRLQGPRNEESIVAVDLCELLDEAEPRGLFKIEIASREGRWRSERRLVQLTDLGVTLRAAPESAAVQVVSIADGSPVVDAEIEIVSLTNQSLALGRSDAQGTALLRWPADAEDRSAYLVRVKAADGDEAFCDMQGHAVELADLGLGGRPYTGDLPEAYVWPGRGILRPGERIEAGVLLRDAAGAAVAGRELVLDFVQPNGRIWRRQHLTTPGSGLLSVGLQTSADAPAGTWQLRVSDGEGGPTLGSALLRVEAFVPYRLEAEMEAVEPLRFGGVCTVKVSGRWLDGSPAAARPVELRLRLGRGEFRPAGAEDFYFGSGEDEAPPGELPSVSGVLGADGTAQFRLSLPADAEQQTLVAYIEAEVMDPSGRSVRAAIQEPVLRPGLHLGLRRSTTGAELRAVDAEGVAIAGELPASLRLERRFYQWRYESFDDGRWRWGVFTDAEVLDEWQVTLQDGALRVPLSLPEGRPWLVLVATADGRSVERCIGEQPARPDRLRVEGPSEAVVAGAAASIIVDAPAAGRGFVTIEGRELLATQVVELQRGRNELTVQVPEGVKVPNLHVVVTLTRPASSVGPDEGPAWLVGGASLPLRRDDLACAVELTAPTEMLPESRIRCELSAPGATAAVLALVDEGVLAVTRHHSPDPAGFFLAQRRLEVAGADLSASLMENASFVAGTKTGGDGDRLAAMLAMGSISPRIRPLALFRSLPLDGEGKGSVEFDLPSYEGRVRVMALVAGPRSFGAAAAETVIRAPLGLQVAVPRMVAPGDEFAVPVTLRNGTGADGVVELSGSAGHGFEFVDEIEQEIALRDGEVRTLDLMVRALQPVDVGVVEASLSAATPAVPTLHFEAGLGDARRAIDSEIHLRELKLMRDEHLGLRLGDAQELRIPDDFDAEGLTAVLELDPVPDRQLRPALEALIEYPYGCVEQTTSRGFALLSCQALLPRMYGDEVPIDAAELVQAAIDRLIGMQRREGGFGWWSRARYEYGFGTVYAMDFLLSAQEQGYRVPQAALDAGLDRVAGIAASTRSPTSLRIMACELQSRAGQPARGLVDWLATQEPGVDSRALLAMTLHRLGEPERARALLTVVDDEALERQQGGMLRSALRTRGMLFRARLALDPADPELPELAWGLTRSLLRTRRRTTQEMGQLLRGLADFYRVGSSTGPASLRGRLDGEPLPEDFGERLELPVKPGSLLSLDAGSRGFALLTIRGRRPPPADVGDGSLELRRVIVDPDSGEQVTSLQRGRVYEVRVVGAALRPLENLVIADLLPGGLEPEAPAPGAGPERSRRDRSLFTAAQIERRDDRVLLFHSGTLEGEFCFRHLVRATFPGNYRAQPLVVEAMYDPGASFTGEAGGRVEILP